MNRSHDLEKLRQLYARKDDLKDDTEGRAWLEQVSGLLRRLAPQRADQFDGLTPYVLSSLSEQAMRPIWDKMGAVVHATIVETEISEKATAPATILAKLIGLSATIDHALAGEVSYTGTGLTRTEEHVERFGSLSEELRQLLPDAFGDLPKRRWSISIGSQKDALREVQRDLREIIARASALGLYQPPKSTLLATPEGRKPKSWRSWLRDIIIGLLVGLSVAYVVYRLGWNR